MEYDLLIYAGDNLANAFDEHKVIRLNEISVAEAETVADILMRHGVSVCLLPHGGLTHGNR